MVSALIFSGPGVECLANADTAVQNPSVHAPVPLEAASGAMQKAGAPPNTVMQNIAVACPGYARVLMSRLSGSYDRVKIPGEVGVRINIIKSKVVDVTQITGPSEYFQEIDRAVREFECVSKGADVYSVLLKIRFVAH